MANIIEYPSNVADKKDDFGYVQFHIFNRKKARKLSLNSASSDPTFVLARGRASGLTETRADADDKRLPAAGKGLQFYKQDSIERIEQVIALPMPNDFTSPLSVGYEVNIQSAIGAMVDLGGNVITGNSSSSDLAKAASMKVQQGVGTAIGTGRDINTSAGFLANDRKEQFFNGVEFRQFSFNYTFTPHNESEVARINEIIRMFRFYMLPDLDPTNTFYITPSEFEIKFMYGGKDNPYITKIDRAFLRNCSVNYAPRSKWTVTQSGMPTEIVVNLEFLEKSTMVREKVETVINEGENAGVSNFASGF